RGQARRADTSGVTAFRRLIGLAVFLAIWEVAGRSGIVQGGVLPPASVVLARFFLLFGDPRFIREAASTLLSWVIAIGLATLIAAALGMLLGSIRPLRLGRGPDHRVSAAAARGRPDPAG